MANTIQHKRSSTSGVTPAASDLSQGELAINIADGKLYTKNSSNAIINLGVTSISGTYVTPSSGNFLNYLSVNGVPVSVSGHSHLSVPQAQSLVTSVFNKTASSIPKFSVVYINGGQGDQPTIQLAIANGEAGSSKTYGITAEAIGSMSAGSVIVAGALSGVNTDIFNPTAPVGNVNGITLYLSPTISGGMTSTKPYAPNHLVSVGTVVRTHQNEGVVEVRIQNGFELEELHNVAISGVTNGQFLQYNSASGLWVPSSSGNFNNLFATSGVFSNQLQVGNSGGLIINNNTITTSSGNDIKIYTASSGGLYIGPDYSINEDPSPYNVSILAETSIGTTSMIRCLEAGIGIGGTSYDISSDPIYISDDISTVVGHFTSLDVNNTPVSVSGHNHSSSDITNFNTSVSGLLTPYQLTLTNPVVGTGVANHVAYWNSTSGITADSGQLYWNSTNNRLGVGTGVPTYSLHVVRTDSDSSPQGGKTLSVVGRDLEVGGQPPSINLKGYTWFGSTNGTCGIGAVLNAAETFGSPSQFFGFQGFNENVTAYNPICFTTQNAPQLFLNTNGNIGVGTASPSSKLHVVGGGIFASISLSAASLINNFNISIPAGYTLAEYEDTNIIEIYNGEQVSVVFAVDGNGKIKYGSIDADKINNFNSSVSGLLTPYQLSLANPVTGAGVANHIAYWNSASGVVADSGQLYWDSTNDRLGIGTSFPTSTLDVNGNVNIDGNITFDSYTESTVSNGNSGTSKTLSLTSGTVHTCTLTGNCTFTMPTATAGKSFTMFLNTGSGNYTASFSGVRWSDNTSPTITSTANKIDILSFISDGSYWYGSFSQNYG